MTTTVTLLLTHVVGGRATASCRRSEPGDRRIGNLREHGHRAGWRFAFDPELWRQAIVAGTAGAVSMAILACAVALARDTTGHDWYAAARLTIADLLIAAGFDEDAPVEYRRADGAVETVSRYGLTVTLEARWAREDILAAAWDGATLGALAGFGGALLCLVLVRRSRDDLRTRRPAYESAPVQQADERAGTALPQERPESAPTAVARVSATAAPGRVTTDRQTASEPPCPSKTKPAVTRRSEPDTGEEGTAVRRRGRKRDYGRWI